MKKNLQIVKSAFSIFLVILCIFILVGNSNAGTLFYKMSAPKTTLQLGEEVTVTVSAWVNDIAATGSNGLDTWQLDLSVNETGIVEISKESGIAKIVLLAPDPDPDWSGWNENINAPFTGEARCITVLQNEIGAPSIIGVGGYSDIFTFTIKALAVGTVTYDICNDSGSGLFGYLSDNTEFDNESFSADGNVLFDAQSSNNVFTVIPVPEPASLSIFALAGLFSIFRKR